MSTVYPVHELFDTFQGEGNYMGWPAFFVRLFGCPVHCPWCDSAGTWHPDYIPKDIEKLTSAEIIREFPRDTQMVIVTGGEPAIHDLTDFVDAIHDRNLRVHLETSGAFPIKGQFDWVTLSPKKWKKPLIPNITLANEFKIIVETEEDIEFYDDLLRDGGIHDNTMRSIWLHPEWSQAKNPLVLEAICDAVKNGKNRFRAGWQLHKCYQVDRLDSRARPNVPLGGDFKKGF